MSASRIKSKLGLAVATAIAAILLPVAGASARTQLNLTSQFGGEVNQNGSNVCSATEACKSGTPAGEAGWFRFPQSVAVYSQATPTVVYVADTANSRIQEFGAYGEFVLTFGREVNETTGGDVCTQVEIETKSVKCKAGVEGTAAGQLGSPDSIAVDPASGDIYVAEYDFSRNGSNESTFGERVQKFTAAGQFVLEIGKEVNETTKGNLCLAGEKCQGPAERLPGSPYEWGGEHGAFNFVSGWGDLLAVAPNPTEPAEGLLYVGDEGRVQEFTALGAYVRQLSLVGQLSSGGPSFPAEGSVTGLTVDGAGDLYVAESQRANETTSVPPGVHKLVLNKTSAKYEEVAQFDAASHFVESMTLDPTGRLTITGLEPSPHGVLYSLTGAEVSQFGAGVVKSSLSYDDATGYLYAANTQGHDITVFEPLITPEVLTGSAGPVQATSAMLMGEANAEESPETIPPSLPSTSFFEYGRCGPGPAPNTCTGHAFGQTAASTPGEETGTAGVPVAAHVAGLYPNQLYHYRLAAKDSNGTSEGSARGFTTTPLPPAIEAAPQTPFVRSETGVLSGSLNPENAATRYHFEYGACEPVASCARSTPDAESSVYAEAALTQEVSGLLPSTTYHARLVATNEYNERTAGPESTFTTGPPVTVAAITGPPGLIGVTSAVVSGTVNPDGEQAAYVFELGVYDGARTHFGIVSSGSAGEATAPVEETLGLSGLQPGTEYAYRIAIRSGYGEATGLVEAFTTGGLSSVLVLPTPLAMLAVPSISFPVQSSVSPHTVSCRRGYKRDKRGRCVKVKKKNKSKPAKGKKSATKRARNPHHN